MSVDPRLARARQKQAAAAAAAAQAEQTPPPPPPPPPEDAPDAPSTNPAVPRNSEAPATDPSLLTDSDFRLKFCTVCASNNNRSMEGHLRLAEAQYPVISFGTGSLVRLPGPSISQPNIYNFNSSTYEQMYNELEQKDSRLYKSNGILNMLERNKGIKRGPERFQDWAIGMPRIQHDTDQGSHGSEGGTVDVIITCEERCWDAVVDNLLTKESPLNRPVHVFNVDIKDSHEEALVGGRAIVDLADSLNAAAREERAAHGGQGWTEGTGGAKAGFDERVPEILADWQTRWPQFPATWTLAWL